MQKTLVIIFILFTKLVVIADEGMWLPQLIEAMAIKDMKKNGCKLSAEQIYSINKSSIKDAIVQFGGGCTGEIISNKGLMLTNHHCAYSIIAGHSTVQKDYLTNGYWAMNAKEEIPCPNLSITIIKKIEDVTQRVLNGVNETITDSKKDSIIKINIKKIEEDIKKNTVYDGQVKPFYYGNEYYLFITETFKDIRLVGAPPSSIGKFGGDTDNWMWPRHNADFSVFRIYADKNNNPAEYSTENVPYTPKYSLPISLKGYQKGDFTLVYGFPGRTQEYLPSQAIDMIMNESNPMKVNLREKRLDIMAEEMKKSDETRLSYASKYATIANYYKKWKGEALGLQKYNALDKKKLIEQQFLNTIKDVSTKNKYVDVFKQFDKIYTEYRVLTKQMDYYSECLFAIDAFTYARSYMSLFIELKKKKNGQNNHFDKLLGDYKKLGAFKGYNKMLDRRTCEAMLTEYRKNVKSEECPYILDSLFNSYQNDAGKLTEFLFSNTNFVDKEKANLMLDELEKYTELYERDPIYVLVTDISKYYSNNVLPQLQYDEHELNELQKQYVQGLREIYKDKKLYPDANFTLRVAFGKVSDYAPKNAVTYNYFTTLDGVMEKENNNDPEFKVPAKLKELYTKKEYGPYADKDGKLHTSFIASNHTTGGNSGSPILNARGQLIGTNFDRNWEGTMSDIMYNPDQCRNITLDVRYTLFIIDKFAGAGYLLNEMTLVK